MKAGAFWGLVAGYACFGMHVGLAQAQQTVSIGSAFPLTGSLAAMGKDAENGTRLAIEEINAAGLSIGGEKVVLRLDGKDDAADPRTATVMAQALVDEGVVAVIGHLNSGATIPASKIYSDAGITEVSGSTNPFYTLQGFRTTYRVSATDAQQGPALADYAVTKLKAKKIAVVDDATTYGQGLADEFEKAVKVLGGTVVSRDATNDKAVDFRAILTKIKGENPDVIMFGGADAGAGPFARQARQLGLTAKIVGGDGICTEKLADLAGGAVDNVFCSEAGAPLEKLPGGKAFEAKYIKRFGQPTQAFAPYYYDAVYIVVAAMKRSNSTDKSKILAAMPATEYRGVLGQTSFDSKGDLKDATISMFTYVSGKKRFLAELPVRSKSS
jgi:branched-chain amino acid transport system substrate-binding protein